ncbi:MAG: hypothetical protein N3A66_07825 [Planctomycetota bacterium]|nr:hypothetical protein [Planctomycetota bacterium]
MKAETDPANGTQAILQWPAQAGVKKWRIERSALGPGGWQPFTCVAELPAEVLSWRDSDLPPGRQNRYRLRAVDQAERETDAGIEAWARALAYEAERLYEEKLVEGVDCEITVQSRQHKASKDRLLVVKPTGEKPAIAFKLGGVPPGKWRLVVQWQNRSGAGACEWSQDGRVLGPPEAQDAHHAFAAYGVPGRPERAIGIVEQTANQPLRITAAIVGDKKPITIDRIRLEAVSFTAQKEKSPSGASKP